MADYTVAFSELDALLQSLPANSVSSPYSINVTGLTASDIGSSSTSGTLGYVLINNATKFVDLSETILPEVTDMSYCFGDCINLMEAPVIPKSVTDMYGCFQSCIRLTTAPVIPNSVVDIVSCFQGCTSLRTAPNIPNSVTNMSFCFSFCTNLMEVSMLVPSSNLDSTNCFFGTTQSISVKTQNKNALEAKLTTPFPNNVTIQQELNWEVPFDNLDGFLSGCLKSSSSVYELNVTGLQERDIGSPYSEGTLGYVIRNNNGVYADLSETVLPEVTNMSNCFLGCTSLTEAPVIPNSVTDMMNCFYNCTSLTTAPVIPNSVTRMSYCFIDCTSLTTAPVIPNSVTDMYGCFSGCTNLTNAPVIPNSVTDMTFCFEDCTSLTTIENFQADTENCIMTNCFRSCASLTYIGVPEILPNATKWQFVYAVEDSDGITMTIETDDTEPVEVETSEHTYEVIGLICDMLFSEDAFDSTRISNYLASRMPWIVESPTSIDANEDWTIIWAKDPNKVKSNFIPAINDTTPSEYNTFSSEKIDSSYAKKSEVSDLIDDTTPSSDKVFSSAKISSDYSTAERKKIQAVVDLNTIVDEGVYWTTTDLIANACTNRPLTGINIYSFSLEVSNKGATTGNITFQKLTCILGEFFRELHQGTWSNWVMVTNTVYATVERAIGTWIDGSILYRKSYHGTGTFSGVTTIDATLKPNNCKIINIYGSEKNKSDGNILPIGYSGGSDISWRVDTSSGFCRANGGYTTSEYWVTIEYIK